jgi:diguanylate cyclase (GGDEF)-like protein
MRDPVTGLFARQQFLHILESELNEANEHRISIALLIVDIRDFRRINRLFGHAAGDAVLRAFADTLEQVKRPQDQIARIGDDQFALILCGVMNPGHAQLAAFKLQRLFDIPTQVDTTAIRCIADIGIALCPEHGSGPDALLGEAEQALARARHSEHRISVANARDDEDISEHWDIELELGESIKKSQLRVYFQPKISLTTGKPIGAEALVRWDSPSRGLVGPNLFIPVAEAIGFIKPLTEWMLNSALRFSSQWPRHWGVQEVSVNIPTRILEQSDFADIVLSARELWKPENATLYLEVLEQSFVGDVATTFDKLKGLRENGIGVAIDDFGTGYSSLAYFRDIPADQLKIDRSFIAGLLADKANENIVGLIINLAHRFGLSVVAEGVEDAATLAALRHMQCDAMQGYLVARPMPAIAFQDWLSSYRVPASSSADTTAS